MRFRRQQSVGVRVGLIGVGLAVVLVVFHLTGSSSSALPIAFNLAVGIAGLAFFVVLVRMVQRDLWLNQFRQNAYLNGVFQTLVLNGPFASFWRVWLHVDQTGRDKDA